MRVHLPLLQRNTAKFYNPAFSLGLGKSQSVGRLVKEVFEVFWGDALAVDEIDDFHALCHEVGAIHGLLLQQRFQAQL
jgi:hypothetical protein